MAKTLSEKLAERAERASGPARDVDPEDFEDAALSDSSSGSEEDATGHYVAVGRSSLRDDGIALSEGKYKGTRVSRADLEHTDSALHGNDTGSEDASGDSEASDDASDSDASASGSGAGESRDESDATSASEDSSSERRPRRAVGISQVLSEEQKHLLSRLTTEQNSDVAKGRAVSAQMQLHERLLDLRIQTQKILTAANTLSAEGVHSPAPLLPLISAVLDLRSRLAGDSAPDHDGDVSLESLAARCAEQDAALSVKRESVLTRWSSKVALSSGQNALNKLTALNQSAAAQVNAVLNDMERLVKRTQVDRSQAGLSHPFLFDDSDFYRLLLKDLVDRRMADTATGGSIKWKVSKQKKKVDTKASKGRKLRYTVIDKIQGFDAPRPVYKWTDKQADDLYAGLLGVSISMDERADEAVPAAEDEIDLNIRVDEDFALFG